ncbi:DUF4347 domain-containing protein [Leptolyngbya ohadii]|uniref:DUF4347 domain-containing protein n=1 Tax=Leptolyngbya ohadii TaxID=1962290 RepID=UPI000B5A18FF|nr:DUF4347 domain-containing protein [Leptolyngbya ohadii]
MIRLNSIQNHNVSLAQSIALVVIDPGVEEYTLLSDSIAPDAVAVVLEADRNGVEQITEILRQYPSVTALHLIGHGAPGVMYLGNGELSLSTIDRDAAAIQSWSISALLLYGCRSAAGDAGTEFLEKLHGLTGATVHASTTRLGQGSWKLDRALPEQRSAAPAALPIAPETLLAYSGTLELDFLEKHAGIISNPNSITLSPDGRFAYVVAAGGRVLNVFSRDAVTGKLTPTDTINVDSPISSLGINPNGKFVVAAFADRGGVTVYSQDASTGKLTFVENYGGSPSSGSVAFNGNPHNANDVYVGGKTPDGFAITLLNQNPTTGRLSFVRRMEGDSFLGPGGEILTDISFIKADPVNKLVYAVGNREDFSGAEAAIIKLRADNTGQLTRESTIYPASIAGWRGMSQEDISSITFDANGRVYAALSRENAIAELESLDVERDNSNGVDGLAGASSIVVSPDGQFVYATGASDNALAIFSRNTSNGDLTFLRTEKDGFNSVDGLAGANSIAVSPDGNFVYITGNSDNAIAIFGKPRTLLESTSGARVNAPFSMTAKFSGNVTGFIASDITVGNGTVSNFVQVDAKTYTFDVTPTREGQVTIDVPRGAALTSSSTQTAAAVQFQRTYDVTSPTVTLSSTAPANVTAPFNVTASFTETVQNFSVSDLLVRNATISNFVAGGDGKTFTFTATPTLDGEVTIDVANDAAQDTAGNNSTAAAQLKRLFNVPTDLRLSNTTLNENVLAGTTVGDLTTIDPNPLDVFTYSLVSGTGDTDNALFTIAGSQLQINTAPDFEAKSSYSVRVRTTDAAGSSFEKILPITINNINEPAIGIRLSSNQVKEGIPADTSIASLTAVDPDTDDLYTYTLVAGDGDTDNSAFSIAGNALKINAAPDATTQPNYSIRVRATDQIGNSYEQKLIINVDNVNDAPIDILLSSSEIAEQVPVETVVGTLEGIDRDTGDTLTYSLVAGDGDTDNAAFLIDGSELKINTSTDFETKSSYEIRIRTTDAAGLSFERPFTINVKDIDETVPNTAPTSISLSPNSVIENSLVNTLIGTLSSMDADPANTFTYSLISGPGSTDNSAFLIVGDQLRLRSTVDYEAQPNLSIRVRTMDQGGLSFEQVLAISVTDVNEAPINLGLSTSSVLENVAPDTIVGTFLPTDPDTGNTFTYSLVSGTGDTDNGSFRIDGNRLRINVSPDYETKAAYNIRLRVTDQNGLSFEKPMTVAIDDVAENFVQYVASEAAEGLQGTLSKLQEVFDTQLLQANLPIVGKLSGAIPAFLHTLRDTIVPVIRSASDLTYSSLETLLNNALKPLFPDVKILGSVNTTENTFEVTLSQGQRVTQLASDLGLPGLGLSRISGNTDGTLNTDLKLVFGSHRTHGFFIDTDRTTINATLDAGLSSGFTSAGKMGLFKVRVTDDDRNRTKANATFNAKLADIDAPGTSDGSRLTSTELRNNFSNPALTTAIVNSDPNLGLKISTDMGSAAIPGINSTLAGDIPNLRFANGNLVAVPASTFTFNNTELSLGSLANNIILPTLRTFNRVMAPLRPVLNLLEYDLRSVFIGQLFPDTDSDGKVTILDLADMGGPQLARFLRAVKTVSDLSQMAATSGDTGLNLGSFQVDNFNPFGDVNSIRGASVFAAGATLGIDAQIDSAGSQGSFIKSFQRADGLKFHLFDTPSNAVRLLIGQPVNLFTYDLPELALNFSVEKEKTFAPLPVVGAVSGSIGISADLAFGYDTFGLQQWADADYPLDQTTRVFNGFYISDRENPDGTGEDVDEFKIALGLELSAGLGVSFKPGISLWGGPYVGVEGTPKFDLKDPDNDGKVRANELISGFPLEFTGVSVEAAAGAKVTGSLGPLEATLAQFTLFDTEVLKYDARSRELELIGMPPRELVALVRETVDRVYTGARDLIARQAAQLAMEAARAVASFVTKAAETVAKTVVSAAKKVWGWLTNEPIADGTVFFDANFNGIQDSNEPFATTFSDGSFGLDIDLAQFDTNRDGQINASEGQLVGAGGYDTYTGLEQSMAFVAPGDAITINPLTTVVSQMMRQGLSQFEAQFYMAEALGLPTGVDLGGFSAAQAIEQNDPTGAKVELAYSQMNNILTQVSHLMSGASNLSDQQVQEQVKQAIAAQFKPGAKVDLSNAADIQKILQTSIANVQATDANPKVQKLVGMMQQIAQVMAIGNQELTRIADKGNLKTLMREFGIVRKVTLGKIAEDLQALGAGKKSLREVVSENSGKAFTRLVNQAEASLRRGTRGDDMLRGGDGRDRLRGQAGDDRIFGGSGRDRLYGDENRDELFGQQGKDYLMGGDGSDQLNGGLKRDQLIGGNGNDVLAGGNASDALIGGQGRDRFVLELGENGSDRIRDFSKQDTLEIAGLATLTGTEVGTTIRRSNFKLAQQAGDSDDYLIYSRKQGILSFDPDGNGAMDPMKIAKLSPGFALTAQDLVMA